MSARICNPCCTSAPSVKDDWSSLYSDRGEQSHGWFEWRSRISPLCLLLYSSSASYGMVHLSVAKISLLLSMWAECLDDWKGIAWYSDRLRSEPPGIGVDSLQEKRFSFSPHSPNRLGGPPSLLSRLLFCRGKAVSACSRPLTSVLPTYPPLPSLKLNSVVLVR
jgi:hypothetical protein